VECKAPIAVTEDKGYHSGPYRPRLIFIDPTHLEEVTRGSRQPNQVNAYRGWDPQWPYSDSDGFNDAAGIAYDGANGYLYVMQANAYRPDGGSSAPWPVVHVYRVEAGAVLTPKPPTDVRVIP
jgi:hypothetical protein